MFGCGKAGLTELGVRSRNSTDLEYLGFRLDAAGAHTARTIMVPELELLLAAVAETIASFEHYRDAVITDNCLQKRSASNRMRTLEHLRVLYGLDDKIPLFRLLKILGKKDPGSLPQLAFLCASARDKMLRELSPWMISHPVGSQVLRSELEEQIELRFPGRFSAITLRSTSQNLNASWAQAGYSQGRKTKTRIKLYTGPAAVTYALLLAYMTGIRGIRLFESAYARLLDCPKDEMFTLAELASRKGWIRMKRIGDVVDVSFDPILNEAEVKLVQD